MRQAPRRRPWFDENGDWLRNRLYPRLVQTLLLAVPVPVFTPPCRGTGWAAPSERIARQPPTIRLAPGIHFMSNDLSQVLNDWKFDPDQMMVRVISADDGRKLIQLRVDLGVLQMEMDGRPDSLRPEGCDSWLDYYEQRCQFHEETHLESSPFLLTEEDCVRLMREGVQYYHRYLSFWHLEMYDLCVRDTERNLRLFAFVRAHTQDERQKLQFDQWRPYVLMMHARAVATPLLNQRKGEEAIRAIEAGIETIREFLDEYHQGHRAEECVELVSLERWRDDLLSMEEHWAAGRPKSAMQILRQRMEAAVAAEEFEEAARLRDQIRKLGEAATDAKPPE